MPGGTHIYGYLHINIQMEVLISNLKYLGSDIFWRSCKRFSTQDHSVSTSTHGYYAYAFDWKGESLKEYWDFTLNALIVPEYSGKGHGPDLIVDDGGDMNLFIHYLFLKYGPVSVCSSTYNEEFKNFLIISKKLLDGGETSK